MNRKDFKVAKLTGILLICLGSLFPSCTRNPVSQEQEKECSSFIGLQVDLINAGKMTSPGKYIENIDSFYRSRNITDPFCLALSYGQKSRYFVNIGNNDKAGAYADSMIFVLGENHLEKKYAADYVNALSLKGEILFNTGHFSQASDYYVRAIQLSESVRDTCALRGFDYGLAMITYKQKKYEDAIDYFRQSFRYNIRCDAHSAYQLQEILDNIALCYEKMGKADSALFYYDSAISFVRKNPNTIGSFMADKALAVVYGNMGGVYLSQGKTDAAISLLKKSYEMNMRPFNDRADAVLTHIKLARALLAKSNLAEAGLALAQIRKELDTITHPLDAEANWRQLMYDYSEKSGKETEALRYYREYATLRDSLWETEKINLQNDLDKELHDKELAGQIDVLQKQNQLNNLYLWVTVIFSVLALVIIILGYVNFKRSRQNVKALTRLNAKINEQKEKLEQTTGELQKSIQDKDRILQVVAHDLRSPVNAIIALCDIIAMEALTDSQKETLSLITNTSQSALTLISEILDLTKASELDLKRDLVDVNDLLRNTVDLLRFKAADKKQTISLSLADQALPIEVNKDRMNRVFGNIITNAIKFSPENSTVCVSSSLLHGKALIEIRDTGIGIPEKLLPYIFESFTSAKRYGTAGEKSYGLGLSICKQIVEAKNGRIWVESTEGQGSSFFIELPLTH